jgi:hypothetical protein
LALSLVLALVLALVHTHTHSLRRDLALRRNLALLTLLLSLLSLLLTTLSLLSLTLTSHLLSHSTFNLSNQLAQPLRVYKMLLATTLPGQLKSLMVVLVESSELLLGVQPRPILGVALALALALGTLTLGVAGVRILLALPLIHGVDVESLSLWRVVWMVYF